MRHQIMTVMLHAFLIINALPPKFLQKRFPYFFHGAVAPSFIWSRRPWSETKKSVLVLILHALVLVLVLQVLRCVVKYSLVTLVVSIILEDTADFQVLV